MRVLIMHPGLSSSDHSTMNQFCAIVDMFAENYRLVNHHDIGYRTTFLKATEFDDEAAC